MVELTEQAPIAADDAEPVKPQIVVELEATQEPPPFKQRSRGKVLAFVFLAVVVLGGGGFAYQSQVAARSARMPTVAPQTAQTTDEPVVTKEPPPPPTHTAEPPRSASALEKKPATGAAGAAPAVSIAPAARAFLDATQLPSGRRIVVDGRVVGSAPRKVAVRCGVHRIQIGDQPPESIDFPCGGEVSFTE